MRRGVGPGLDMAVRSAYWRGVRTAGLPTRPVRRSGPPSWRTRSPEHRISMRHRGPDEPGTWADDDTDPTIVFGFNRLSIIDIAHSHQPLRLGPAGEPEPLRAGLQRRDLQLSRAAGGVVGAPRRRVRHRRRRRGDHRRVPPLGHRGAAPAARHVRVRPLGHEGAGVVLRARPVRHQAAVHGDRRGRHRRRQREEEPAGPRSGRGHRPRASTSAPCSTTRCCSTCRNRRRCTAASAGWSREAMRRIRPGGTPRGDAVLRATVQRGPVRRRAPSRPATTRSPQCSRIRSPSTCAPT